MTEEIEYYSNCCDAPPYSEDVVDANDLLGQCMKCGMGSTLLLILWTALIISHIIKGYNWLPLTLVYLGLIPFALSTHRQLDE